jgi:outer membrane protein OmpA-like peptidoglycan-associated protein
VSSSSSCRARKTIAASSSTLGDVLFQTGRAELTAECGPRMDKLASYLNQFPDKSLLIEGYTIRSAPTRCNQELSIRRLKRCVRRWRSEA